MFLLKVRLLDHPLRINVRATLLDQRDLDMSFLADSSKLWFSIWPAFKTRSPSGALLPLFGGGSPYYSRQRKNGYPYSNLSAGGPRKAQTSGMGIPKKRKPPISFDLHGFWRASCDWECGVFVDGKLLGEHRGAYEPFSFELPTGAAWV